MKKKAVSALVATVLLIVATISIGLIIMSFTKTSSEKVTEQFKLMSNQVECSDIQLSIDSFNPLHTNVDLRGLILKNRGTLGITNIQFRIYKQEIESKTAEDYAWKETDLTGPEFNWNNKLLPGNGIITENLNTEYDNINKIELIPIIIVDDQNIGCEDKIITWKQ